MVYDRNESRPALHRLFNESEEMRSSPSRQRMALVLPISRIEVPVLNAYHNRNDSIRIAPIIHIHTQRMLPPAADTANAKTRDAMQK
jgi:hypothetical protein